MNTMNTRGQDNRAIENAMMKCQTADEMRRALENGYRRVRDAARAEWEQRFAGKDPSDSCVSVTITAVDAEERAHTARGAGFVKATKPAQHKPDSRLALPRFAH